MSNSLELDSSPRISWVHESCAHLAGGLSPKNCFIFGSVRSTNVMTVHFAEQPLMSVKPTSLLLDESSPPRSQISLEGRSKERRSKSFTLVASPCQPVLMPGRATSCWAAGVAGPLSPSVLRTWSPTMVLRSTITAPKASSTVRRRMGADM